MRILKSVFLFTFMTLTLFSVDELLAQPRLRMKAHRVIRRTAITIIAARKDVKTGKVYTGNYARSVAHQKYARMLYRQGAFLRSIHHSRKARMLAVLAIRANKGSAVKEGSFTAEEEELMKNSPSDDELEKELMKAMPNEKMKDEDVIDVEPDVDLKEKE